MARPIPASVDYALVGGGLQSALTALALRRWQPGARVLVVERGPVLGGNHLWSFHAGDLSGGMDEAIEPLVIRRWPGHSVRFPGLARRLTAPYATMSSDRVHEVLTGLADDRLALALGTHARRVERDRVELGDGREVRAGVVIDARGPGRAARQPGAYQKFVGLELETRAPLPLSEPILMDACVPQSDGFRFFYVLPLDERRVLIEDTYFSDTPALDVARLRVEIGAYAARLGLGAARVVREERGVLPLPTRLAPMPEARSPFVAGFAGGWFHPTTGYSVPLAARLAEAIATESVEALPATFERLARRHESQAGFGVLLNRLLYGAFAPEDRWNVLERFYRLPTDTIVRFYSMNLTPLDRARILIGRPPRGISLRFAMDRGAAVLRGAAA